MVTRQGSTRPADVAAALVANPPTIVDVPLVFRVGQGARCFGQRPPTALLLECALDGLPNEGAAASRTGHSVLLADQCVVKFNVQTHGLSVAHKLGGEATDSRLVRSRHTSGVRPRLPRSGPPCGGSSGPRWPSSRDLTGVAHAGQGGPDRLIVNYRCWGQGCPPGSTPRQVSARLVPANDVPARHDAASFRTPGRTRSPGPPERSGRRRRSGRPRQRFLARGHLDDREPAETALVSG